MKEEDEKKVIIVQSLVRRHLARRKYEKLVLQQKRRVLVAQEMLNTERYYVKALTAMVEHFLLPLRNSVEIKNGKLFAEVLFSNVELIWAFNKEFLASLEKRLVNFQARDSIGDLFLKMVPFLKLYSSYCVNHQAAITKFEELKANERMDLFFKKAAADAKLNHDLPALLIMPIQRVPRYKLLIEEMLRQTVEHHKDYTDLEKALKKTREVAEFVNERVRNEEELEKLLALQKRIKGTCPQLAIVGRMLLHQGLLNKVCRKASKKRNFFLLNDMLFYCSKVDSVSDNFVFHRSFSLETLKVSDLADSQRYKNAFQILSVGKSFVVFGDTPAEKYEWLSKLSHAVQAPKKKILIETTINEGEEGGAAPVWVQDDETNRCMLCKDEFSVFFRRHHCRKCGKLVCGNCSTQRMKLEHISKEPLRVCDLCSGFQDGPSGARTVSEKEEGTISSNSLSSISSTDISDASQTKPDDGHLQPVVFVQNMYLYDNLSSPPNVLDPDEAALEAFEKFEEDIRKTAGDKASSDTSKENIGEQKTQEEKEDKDGEIDKGEAGRAATEEQKTKSPTPGDQPLEHPIVMKTDYAGAGETPTSAIPSPTNKPRRPHSPLLNEQPITSPPSSPRTRAAAPLSPRQAGRSPSPIPAQQFTLSPHIQSPAAAGFVKGVTGRPQRPIGMGLGTNRIGHPESSPLSSPRDASHSTLPDLPVNPSSLPLIPTYSSSASTPTIQSSTPTSIISFATTFTKE